MTYLQVLGEKSLNKEIQSVDRVKANNEGWGTWRLETEGIVDSPRPREGRETMVLTEATESRSEGRAGVWLSVEEVAMVHTVVR